MKKITILAALILSAAISPANSLLASEDNSLEVVSNNAVSKEDQIINEMMNSLDSSKKVLQLPDGGFIQGELIEYEDDSENAKVKTYYNSEFSQNAVSIPDAKKILKLDAFKLKTGITEITPYGSSYPTAVRVLPHNATYISNGFSASGWRFSELKFKAAAGTGTWLLWTSYGDSALVGTLWQAQQRTGTTLQPSTPKYVNAVDWLMYYTYNPNYNSYYVVSNR